MAEVSTDDSLPIVSVTTSRIHMVDVDGAKIIYFGSPYRWHEAALTDWLADIGHPLRDMLDEGVAMPAVSSSARYLRPLRLDDVITIELRVGQFGTSSMVIGADVRKDDGEIAVEVRTANVWTRFHDDGTLSAEPIPQWFRDVTRAVETA